MLQVQDLCYHPATLPQPILRDLSFELGLNQLGLIVGKSGAGKSTLLEILAGLARPTRGRIAWGGTELSPQQLRSMAGLVFQFPERHFCGLTVLEEMRFGHPELQQKEIENVLKQVGLEGIPLCTSPNHLSGGQQRRLALAVQLIRGPLLLLLDEPTAGLDWSVRRQLIELLARLKSTWTVLVVSHDPEELSSIADVRWILQAGSLQPLPTDALLQR
ncbi:energy-coupling factor transport system ATP-binding protein [Thermostichus sp. MS-CIW-21]|jgi:energy-coupling factor transport system ATP-binding protein|uniref:ABC transporter ATP-binding protein n=1 Tax=unclassified Synechococcus TaxID=2626047 RepID=UPI00006944B5|nr:MULTISPECIES: ABC transporter ATP-binding protein [unclassified Synechococcus]ABC99787.1 ABC transporter, ATP-binding protein [Synechococcus sp. JA-3-3Ab]PIK87274.1 lytic murein transglycosylase [Synechococcus sp. 63AY4M2]PIK92629.1 lytic murein transglycosylase [Synechococcus sp. 65AY6Li]PIK93986.1 lytic murein transglycosylase [Synechococcus sp. 60AY4M2]PIK98571.1 lytic murein transglycosylase [Synechococcus sp. 63AY4M1]